MQVPGSGSPRPSKRALSVPGGFCMTLLVDPPSPRDRGGQRQSTQRSATDQLDSAQGGHVDGADTQVDGALVKVDGAPVKVEAAQAKAADVRAAGVDSAQPDTDQPDTASAPKLAEPPIPGGRV